MATDTLSTSPNSVRALNALFLEREGKEQQDIDRIHLLDEFIKNLPDAVLKRKVEDIAPGSINDPVSMLFRRADITLDDFKEYALFDKSRPYTRNLIATDNENYSLLLLCWNPGKESPIHDHPCDGCWLKVFCGSVRECRYDSNLHCISDETFVEGQQGYITDSMGYHKVGNPSDVEPSITLHLYAPPILRCRVWHTEDPTCEECVKSSNFSEFGKVVTADQCH